MSLFIEPWKRKPIMAAKQPSKMLNKIFWRLFFFFSLKPDRCEGGKNKFRYSEIMTKVFLGNVLLTTETIK